MFNLEIRKTHRYVGEYQYLDQWETIGTLDVLKSETVLRADATEDDEYDICEPYTTRHHVRVESEEPKEKIERVLLDHFTKQGCAHDWDCCGCRSYRADTAVQDSGPYWIVTVHSSRNF